MSKTALVTGGTGLVGSHITRELLDKGWYVRVLTRNKAARVPDVQMIYGSITNADKLKDAVKGVDAVFHCAGEINNEQLMKEVNVHGTECLLNALKNEHIKHFCYISSVSVQGVSLHGEVNEDDMSGPVSEYARTKLAAETLVLNSLTECNVSILRPTNIVDESRPGVIIHAMKNSLMSKIHMIFEGNDVAHIVHAKDVASAAVFFLDVPLDRPTPFIVSTDSPRNTVMGMFQQYFSNTKTFDKKRIFSIPPIFTHMIRSVKHMGRCLPGTVRFSSERLHAYGFEFPLGFSGAIDDIARHHVENPNTNEKVSR